MVTIAIELPEDVAEKARAAGMLSSNRIAELIETEIERQRQEAAQRLIEIAEDLQAAAKDDLAHITDDEVMALVDDEIKAYRAEKREQRKKVDS